MAAPCFIVWNQAMPTTAAYTGVTTGTAIKTMLQLVPNANTKIRLIEWGYTFVTAPGANVQCELVETGTVTATVTAHVIAGIMPYNDQGAVDTSLSLGTSATGYTSSAEGSTTATRVLDYHEESGLFLNRMYSLGREPEIGPGKVLRIRATTSSAVTMSCYVIYES